MRKYVVSGLFVGCQFLASFGIVVLISRASDDAGRVAFFIFQAIYFPLTALLSNSKILIQYRGERASGRWLAIDAVATAACVLALYALGGGRYGTLEAMLFALSVPLAYRMSASFALLQHGGGGGALALVPVGIAVLRLLVCWLLLAQGPAVAFFGAMLAGWGAAQGLQGLLADGQGRANQPSEARAQLPIFGFSLATVMTFHWDRLALGQLGAEEAVIASGVVITWVLGPMNVLYALVFRAEAQMTLGRHQAAFATRLWLRQAGVFGGFALAYGVVLIGLWEPLNRLMFPFFEGSVLLPVLLLVAVTSDRIANLAVFTRNEARLFAAVGVLKPVLILGGVAVFLVSGVPPLPENAYGFYVGISVIYLCSVLYAVTKPVRAKSG